MKRLLCIALIVTGGILIGMDLRPPRDAIAKPDQAAAVKLAATDVNANTITCREINIVDDDGKAKITMLSTAGTTGIWLHGKDANQGVAIVSTNGSPAFISCYNVATKTYPGGFQFAVTLDPDGSPSIQFQDKDGKLKFAKIDALVAK